MIRPMKINRDRFAIKPGMAIPADYLSRMKRAYLEEGPEPSHRLYGWIA